MSEIHFSDTYDEARDRFKAAAAAAGATVDSYPIEAECREELTIDVAMLGSDDAPTVVTTSGVHGVEGFFGSAIQHALLDRLASGDAGPGVRHVLIHGVNPFGFCRLRRFNEDNVDLNRNFLGEDEEYRGAPEGYVRLNGFLNPPSPPSPLEPFKLKAIWNIWRTGKQALKQAVAGGQYEFPQGLFFGGRGPCQSTSIVQQQCGQWIGSAAKILHVDFHSGLGPYGSYKLLLVDSADSAGYAWYPNVFGGDSVEPLEASTGTAYKVSGIFGSWMQNRFKSREYRFVGAEFGTYDVVRVLGAIRAENRAHHYATEQSPSYHAAKRELLECFCPQDSAWRNKVVEAGLQIIARGSAALMGAVDGH